MTLLTKEVAYVWRLQGTMKGVVVLLVLILTLELYQFLLCRPFQSYGPSVTESPVHMNRGCAPNLTLIPKESDEESALFANTGGVVFRRETYQKGLATKTMIFPSVLWNFPYGGLGNQLFNYACAYALARKHDVPLYFYTNHAESILKFGKPTKKRKFGLKARPFALDLLNIPLFEGNLVDSSWKLSKTHVKDIYDRDILSQNYVLREDKALKALGYCQSELFFEPVKDEIRRLFVPNINRTEAMDPHRISNWMKIIDSSEESVAVHFRRGDFSKLLRVPVSFQIQAMAQITNMLKKRSGSRNPTFFLFADDPDGIKKELKSFGFQLEDGRHYFVADKGGKMLEDFYLMTKCKHSIIPCSSFSWWAAYLNSNPQKIVIAAHKNKMYYKKNPFSQWAWRYLYYPSSWFVQDPLFNVTKGKALKN